MKVTTALTGEDRHTAEKNRESWSQPAQGEHPLPPHSCCCSGSGTAPSMSSGDPHPRGSEPWQSLVPAKLSLPSHAFPRVYPALASQDNSLGAPCPFPTPGTMHPRLQILTEQEKLVLLAGIEVSVCAVLRAPCMASALPVPQSHSYRTHCLLGNSPAHVGRLHQGWVTPHFAFLAWEREFVMGNSEFLLTINRHNVRVFAQP